MIPADAYPRAVYGSDQRLTPSEIRPEITDHAVLLWIGGLLIRTPRDADDTQLTAGADIAHRIAMAAEQHARACEDLLAQRAAARAAQTDQAAETAAGAAP